MELSQKEEVREAILRMPDLPTLPSNVIVLMDMMRDSESSASDAIELIEQDQVLAASILKLLNSSYYSQARAIGSVAYAVAILGYNEVWNLVLSSAVMDMISAEELNLWNHSHSCSVLARELFDEEDIHCHQTIHLSALMHDLGKIVLINYDSEIYDMVRGRVAAEGGADHLSERALFGVDHAEVGSWLLESWQLGEAEVAPIAHHHDSELPEKFGVDVAVLMLVDYIDHRARGHDVPAPDPSLLEAAGLAEIDVDSWVERQVATIEELGAADVASDV